MLVYHQKKKIQQTSKILIRLMEEDGTDSITIHQRPLQTL